MFHFIWDLVIYPFDPHKETNKFGMFLKMMFKDYPAYFWIKPSFRKIIALPLLIVFCIFRRKKTSDKQ